MVSIIMPNYNGEKFLECAIRSIINQTYTDWELLVVDDLSTDNSERIILDLLIEDERIKYFPLKSKGFSYGARNFALSKVRGDFVAFCDSDDYWLPKKLETQLTHMELNDCCFSFHSYTAFKNGTETFTSFAPNILDYHSYLKNTVIGCSTVLISANLLQDSKFPELKRSQDMALWLILLQKTPFACGIEEVLSVYRIHDSATTNNKILASLSVFEVYFFLKISWFSAVYLWFNYVFNALKKRILF